VWLKQERACFASTKPCVQNQIPPKKENNNSKKKKIIQGKFKGK
jgi:hypothetical protein